jgi:membrane protease YdiL (CAAX protease family)
MKARDMLLYFALSAVPIATFLLTDYPDTNFYLSLLMISLIVIVWYRHYHKEPDQLLDYDENLTSTSLGFIAAGVLGIIVAGSLIFASNSLFYVPRHSLEFKFGQIALSGFWADMLFQMVLVAPSEECVKLITHLSFFSWLKDVVDKDIAKFISIIAPISFWALLHTYRNPNYTGPMMLTAVAAAFVGGLIIYGVMRLNESLLAAILTHAIYNCVVVYLLAGSA